MFLYLNLQYKQYFIYLMGNRLYKYVQYEK